MSCFILDSSFMSCFISDFWKNTLSWLYIWLISDFIIGIFDSSGVLVTTLGTGYYIVPSQVITNGGTSSTYVMLFSTQTVTILAGQKLCVSFSLDSIVLNQAGVINLNILAGSYFENKAINTGIFDGD